MIRKFPITGASLQHAFWNVVGVFPTKLGAFYSYLLTIFLMGLALWMRLAIAPVTAGLQYITFFPAVTLAAIAGGYRAGLLATLLGMIFATTIFTPPYYSISWAVLHTSLWSNLVFLTDGLILTFSIEALHRFRQKNKLALEIAEGFQAIFDFAAAGIARVGPDGKWLEVNKRLCEIVGYSADELLRLRFQDITHPGDLDTDIYYLKQLLAGNIQSFTSEKRYVRKSGEPVWVNLAVAVEKNEDGSSKDFITVIEDISARKQIEQSLRIAQQSLDHTLEAICRISPDGKIVYANEATCRHLGYSRDELQGMSVPDIDPNWTQQAWDAGSKLIMSKELSLFETLHKRKDGTIIPVEIFATYINLDGEAYFHASVRDITTRKSTENQLRIAASTFETHDAIMVTDAKGDILRVNQSFVSVTGFSEDEVIGKNPRILRSGKHDRPFYEAMWQQLLNTGVWDGEIWDRRKNGEIYPKWLTITAVKNISGETSEYIAIFSDITERKKSEEEIHALAFYDALTKLPNRRLLIDRLHQAISASVRSGLNGALLFIDLDHFKTLNDTLGHHVGDQLLQQVALRILSCVRECDTVARLGGDEFVVMLPDIDQDMEVSGALTKQIGRKVLDALNHIYSFGGHEFHCSSSIGITLFNDRTTSVDDLLKQADIAMYQAKTAGRNALRFFDPEMQAIINHQATLERELHKAVENEQFELYYQIQYSNNDLPLGAEALIRWRHPERGMVSPAEFIPIAESSHLIIEVGNWVLNTACKQLQEWAQYDLSHKLILAINVSAHQFGMPDFVDTVENAIKTYRIEPSRLKLELTESVILRDVAEVIDKMHALKVLGIRLSLDDFGTGYSSLSYLKKLPLDQIKIDQSFVRDIVSDASDAMMVKTIIEMAKNFRLNVIAEGVETTEQFEFLKKNGCLAYQGYLFSKPVPIAEFETLLKQHSSLAVT